MDLTFDFGATVTAESKIGSTVTGPFTITAVDDDGTLSPGDLVIFGGGAPYEYLGTTPDGGIVIDQTGNGTGDDPLEFLVLSDTAQTVGADLILDTSGSYIYCFCRGTMIRTPCGERPVEALAVGDMVETLDNGPQPLRWIGRTRLSAARLALSPELAPVRFAPQVLGTGRALEVSPEHRILVSGWRAEILFGEPQALVAARDLVNDATITRFRPRDGVEYWHLLFDRHEIVWGNGMPSESFHPAEVFAGPADAATRAEVLRLFPDLETAQAVAPARLQVPAMAGRLPLF